MQGAPSPSGHPDAWVSWLTGSAGPSPCQGAHCAQGIGRRLEAFPVRYAPASRGRQPPLPGV